MSFLYCTNITDVLTYQLLIDQCQKHSMLKHSKLCYMNRNKDNYIIIK